MKKINFLVAEDHLMARRGIVQILIQNNLVMDLWEAGTGTETVRICLENPIDLVLMDFNMPEMNGFEAAKRILARKKNIKILAFTQYDELPVVMNFLQIGVRGFLTKMADEKELVDAIRTLMNGDYYYHSQFDNRINKWLKQGLSINIPKIHFSQREVQMVTLISRGKTSNEIAKELDISPRTVETYRYDLIKKTKSKNTADLVGYVYRNGLV
ncbi:MAG: response regulator transcription factor [Cyclobacteriaceae bacterium]